MAIDQQKLEQFLGNAVNDLGAGISALLLRPTETLFHMLSGRRNSYWTGGEDTKDEMLTVQ